MAKTPKMLQEKRFPNTFLETLHNITLIFIRLVLYSLDTILLYFFPVTPEREHLYAHIIRACIFVPMYVALIIVAIILALPWVPVWVYLQKYRRPYHISVGRHRTSLDDIKVKNEYSICTSNLCMISEFIARMSNVKDMAVRMRKVGEEIAASQTHLNDNTKHSNVNGVGLDKGDFEKGVSTSFPPDLDFICFQEVCDVSIQAGKELSKHLHDCGYHYTLYDVGINEWKLNMYLLSSWLAFASKYPIMDATYHPYSYKCSGHSYASVGLLLVKVYLGKRADGKSLVGIIANTHLQSYVDEEKKNIPVYQLDSILNWQQEFQEKSVTEDEVIRFNFLCGDFNFDNMSPGESDCWKHRLFEVYHDVCRQKPGIDHEWTVGTEMRLCTVGDMEVSTPDKLKSVLEDKYLRTKYFLDGNIQMTMTEEIGWQKGPEKEEYDKQTHSGVEGRRRIDYVVFNKKFPVVVKKFLFVTQLAGLTDHIPVCMTFQPEVN